LPELKGKGYPAPVKLDTGNGAPPKSRPAQAAKRG